MIEVNHDVASQENRNLRLAKESHNAERVFCE